MRLWEDGFDHYGDDETNLIDGSYANYSTSTLATNFFVTGSHSIKIGGNNFNGDGFRKVLPTAIDKMGAMGRFYLDGMPPSNTVARIFNFFTATPNVTQLSCVVDANGCLRFYRGSFYFTLNGENGTLVAQSDPIIVASAWNHIEVQVYIHATLGWVRAAVNGVHRFEATGLNTLYNADKIVSVGQSNSYSGNLGAANYYMDDYILYDFSGDSAVDTDFCPPVDGAGKATGYIGELQVWPLFPNGDTTEAGWLKSSGTEGYALIDEPSPNDADYIYSTAAGDLSEFDLDDLPDEITYVRGLGVHARLSKSDSGAAMIKVGMKSVAATDDAAERPVTTIPTYWRDTIDVDPNSSARWTRPSLNAAWLRLTRSV